MRAFFIFFLIVVVPFKIFCQDNNSNFSHIGVEHGLSHSAVTCITQDNSGFIWMGTNSGLNKYNGYEFTVFEHDEEKANTISNNKINCIYKDNSGILWVGTRRGISKYNESTNTFSSFFPTIKKGSLLRENHITTIFQDRSGILWLGSVHGLIKADYKKNSFSLYEHEPNHPEALEVNAILSIHEDKWGNLWVGTSKGISFFDRVSEKFTRIFLNNEESDETPLKNTVTAIVEDKSGILWLGTTGDGLKRFDPKDRSFLVLKKDSINTNSISSNNILSLLLDSFGTLWIGTQGFGLNSLQIETGVFNRHLRDPLIKNSINDNSITSLFEDKGKVLWVGTFLGGVNKLDLSRKKIVKIDFEPFRNDVSDNNILSVYKGNSGFLWVGNSSGFYKIIERSDETIFYPITTVYPKSRGFDGAKTLYEDNSGNLWLGLAGGGLKIFNIESGKFSYYFHTKEYPTLPSNIINIIHQDKKGTIWLGTDDGICSYNSVNSSFKKYNIPIDDNRRVMVTSILETSPHQLLVVTAHHGLYSFNTLENIITKIVNKADPNHFKGKLISGAFMDRSGIVWLKIASGGLEVFDTRTSTFSAVKKPKDLSKVTVVGINQDGKGNLWLSTVKDGLKKYNQKTGGLVTYTQQDGFLSNEYTRAVFKGKLGEFYFGNRKGLNIFHPDSIYPNTYVPPIVLTSFKVFETPRFFSKKGIDLKYNQNFFSLEFAALSYALPEKNKYAYKLEGVDKDWVESGTRRFASYTDIGPGSYTFSVRGSNHDGVWNKEGTSVKINITPPWWKTPLAYIAYALLVAGSFFGIFYYSLSRQRLNQRLKLKSLESQKLQELDQLKSRFFANISHEFRTPLTLIVSPLEKMIEDQVDESQKKDYYHLMKKNANRLLILINQLLDLSKLEAKGMSLETSSGDLIEFLKTLTLSFEPLAIDKKIKLKFSANQNHLWTFFDKDKIEKIITNLLSNAFKFTLPDGAISVNIEVKAREGSYKTVVIQVEDTGIGISSSKIGRVFDRFYQVDNSYTKSFEGAGIGLALAKELVQLHKGEITVESDEGKGTCFTVQLSFEEVIKEGQTHVSEEVIHGSAPVEFTLEHLKAPKEVHDLPKPKVEGPLILVIEDNYDLRKYICSTFAQPYQFLEAADGEEGMKIALQSIPDIIITDLMMPKVDGVELCRRLKADERTSHIPIIMLTAKSTVKSRIEGLETGADEYLTKPFVIQELRVRVENLIEQRRKLREIFKKKFSIQTSPEEATSVDQKFLQRVVAAIEANISNPNLTVEFLEKAVGMDRTYLFRKLKALTGFAPSDFIRECRLRKAAALLNQKAGNVSEIAYKVGIVNLSYFAKSFKQTFGVSPSTYSKNQDQNSK